MNKLAIAMGLLCSAPVFAFDMSQPEHNDVSNLVWTGHTSPDTDTVVSAMLAAHIFGGTATVPEAINPESRFILEHCKLDAPKQVSDYSGYQVGLVDFNQQTQLASSIAQDSIVAIIDHHAIGGSPINAPQIISMDIRPWGSTATILVDKARELSIELPEPLACAALGAVLSDTVVLTSSTTTGYDHSYAEQLTSLAEIADMAEFGEQMLIAKSDLSHMPASQILTLDYKNFEYGGKKVGIGVAETITADQLIERKDELLQAMASYKQQKQLDHLFFSITDTKNQRANLLWVDEQDAAVLAQAFDGNTSAGMLSLEGVTSRKRQIGPAIQRALEN